jgi:hypothetical protein
MVLFRELLVATLSYLNSKGSLYKKNQIAFKSLTTAKRERTSYLYSTDKNTTKGPAFKDLLNQ